MSSNTKYELTAKAVFEAKDIEDAFRKLAEHFTAFANNQETPIQFDVGTHISIHKYEDKNPFKS